MSFCCGASKIGVISDIKTNGILIKNVPSLYCPVCKNEESHPKSNDTINFIMSMANEDNLKTISFDYFMNKQDYEELFEDCSTIDNGVGHETIQSQIDIALDLLTFATNIEDLEWEAQLKERLKTLGQKIKLTKST